MGDIIKSLLFCLICMRVFFPPLWATCSACFLQICFLDKWTAKTLIVLSYTFFFIRTPNFLPRLDVLIFSAISASNVLIDVLNYFTLKIKYLYSTTVYLILNITVFSLSYNMNWSWKECNRILYWPWQILTQIWKKNISPPKIEAGHVLMMFLFFLGFQPGCSYKRCSYKKKKVYTRFQMRPRICIRGSVCPFVRMSVCPWVRSYITIIYIGALWAHRVADFSS